ncbi:MAG: hypothetical protein IT210_14575 [Armatimonadetes bacterium]|nr:hypothetical protein [Armatimonadota bacterium]
MGGYRELFQELLGQMDILKELAGDEQPELEDFILLAQARLDFTVLENLLALIDEYTYFEFDRRRQNASRKEESEARPPRHCVTCGKLLTGAKRKYCSRICQYGGVINIARPECINCGQPLKRKAKWCAACRKEHLREYNREYARARRARAKGDRMKRAA